MAKEIHVENSYKGDKVVITYDDDSMCAYHVVDGMVPVEVFRRLEVAMAHGNTIKVKGFV